MSDSYTPITQGLREYIERHPTMMHAVGLADLLDNIDAIHRSLEAENERLRDASERGDDWIKLPVDADNMPVHNGDVMEWPDGKTFEVIGIGDGVLFYTEHECDGPAEWTGASTKRHHQPDTWESIIEDAIGLGGDGCYSNIDTDRLVARCKALCERTREGEE